MTQLPSLKPRHVEKILLKNGFVIKRQAGSHRIFYNATTDAIVILPVHSKDIPTSTLRSIIKQSKLSEEIFFKK